MSFSSEQKVNIISQQVKSPCCRRAFLSGAIFAKACFSDGRILLSVERREYAEAIAKLVREFYGKEAKILAPKRGGRCVNISFDSPAVNKYLSELSECTGLFVAKCAACESAFLRGLFLAGGRASDPEKQYSLEFSVGERTDLLFDYLASLGLTPRVASKPTGRIIYFRNGSDIEEFLAHASMNNAMFNVIDARFSAEARKNLMRTLNCETNNMQKTVNAAVEQCKLIEELEKANLLTSLPDEIEAVARLRMSYPEYSLSQLAAVANPSITKSGLTHRLKKLTEEGKRLLHKK